MSERTCRRAPSRPRPTTPHHELRAALARPLGPALSLLAALALGLCAAGAAQAAPPTVWVISSLQRVRPDDAAGTATSLPLAAAKGESESFQIVVKAPAGNGLTNVNVTSPSLGATQLTLYREYYSYLASGSGDWASNLNKPEKPGWFPDGLVPFTDPSTGHPLTGGSIPGAPFSVAASKNQPVWVDLAVPRSATAGIYSGAFTVTSDQGSASVTVSLKVWNFTLPLKPALESCFMYWPTSDGGMGRGLLQPDEELLKNRINPVSTSTSYERQFIDTLGMQSISMPFWSSADQATGAMSPAPSVASIQSAKAQHQQDLDFYCYSADEISNPALYPGIKSWGLNLHAAGVDQLITMPPVPELFDDGSGTGRSAVDDWVILPKQYEADLSNVLAAQAKGDRVWSYNCTQQDDYSPKWLLDYAPLNYRIQPGFINQSLGLVGLLYWRVDWWTVDPWTSTYPWPYLPGEGLLVYPGAQVGLPGQVVPSMRLKYLRDGVDDYDYIQLLKQQGYGDWALGVARTVGPDWRNWTRDPNALEAARLQLGDKLDLLGGGDGGGGLTFSDVPTGFWAAPQIYACVTAGLVKGYDDGTYRPAEKLPRDQMAVYLARALAGGDSAVPAGPAQPTFSDVPTTQWAYNYIEYAAARGVVKGYGDGNYGPSARVTRGQMAAFMARAIASPVGEAGLTSYTPPTTPTYTDVAPDYWAYKYIEYLSAQGVVKGYAEDNTYRPTKIVTRDQMAVYVARAFALPL